MHAHIEFAKNERRDAVIINQPNSVRVESSWQLLTDTATITLAKNVEDFNRYAIKEVFKPGDAVTIQLGANGTLTQYFVGYIKNVSADVPITIELEDEMYNLKRTPVNISLRQATLPQLLNAISPVKVDAEEYQLGNVRFAKMTVAGVLQKLKEEYGIYSYIKNGVLVSGKIYDDDKEMKPLSVVIERQAVGDNLQYKEAEDINIRLEAVSTMPDGTKISVTVGDENGQSRKLAFYNIKDKAELEKQAKKSLELYKYSGFRGEVELFGFEPIVHGQIIALKSDLYPEREGEHFVDRTTVEFDDTPKFRIKAELGKRA